MGNAGVAVHVLSTPQALALWRTAKCSGDEAQRLKAALAVAVSLTKRTPHGNILAHFESDAEYRELEDDLDKAAMRLTSQR